MTRRCDYYIEYMPGNFLKKGTGGYQCKRNASYTNGEKFVCKQHAKNPATPLRKADGNIMSGYYPITDTE